MDSYPKLKIHFLFIGSVIVLFVLLILIFFKYQNPLIKGLVLRSEKGISFKSKLLNQVQEQKKSNFSNKKKTQKAAIQKPKLLGTVTIDGRKNFAIIEDAISNKQDVFMEGDIINDRFSIKKILREKIILYDTHKRDHSLIIGSDEVFTATNIDTTKFKTLKAGYKPRTISIEKANFENYMKYQDAILKQAVFRSRVNNGKLEGLIITKIKPNSVFRLLRIRNGDILLSGNGKKFNTDADLNSFFESLKNSSQASLAIGRRGRLQELQYNIIGDMKN